MEQESVFLAAPTDTRTGKPLRILLAEDGLVNQQVACELLHLHGHHVVLAGNGIEALAALDREPFDVVLMDVHMPAMDGLEAAAAIRRKEQITGNRVPIIAMTGCVMQEDRDRCRQAGMDGYLTKPIDAQTLFAALERNESLTSGAGAEAISADPVLDWDAAVQRMGGRADLLRQMVRLFFLEGGKLLTQLQQSIRAGDTVQLRRVAHALKNSAACFAAHPTEAAAQRLETMGQEDRLEGVERALNELEHAIDQLKLALLAHLPQPASARSAPTTKGQG